MTASATSPPPAFQQREHTEKWLKVSELTVVWPEAQRPLSEKRAKEIADNFDPEVFGVVLVCRLPDGRNHVGDGWTRVTAVRMLYNEHQQVPCKIYPVPGGPEGAREAAQIFCDANGFRAKPAAIDMYRARVTGGYPDEVGVQRVLDGLGFKVGMQESQGYIRAVSSLLSIFRQFGATGLHNTLVNILATWGREPAAYDAFILRGFAQFLARTENTLDHQKLAKKLERRYTPGRLLGTAKANKESFRGSLANAVCELLFQCASKRSSRATAEPPASASTSPRRRAAA